MLEERDTYTFCDLSFAMLQKKNTTFVVFVLSGKVLNINSKYLSLLCRSSQETGCIELNVHVDLSRTWCVRRKIVNEKNKNVKYTLCTVKFYDF